jgi:hypothetical protein
MVPPPGSSEAYALPAKRSGLPILLIVVLVPVVLLVLLTCAGVLMGLLLPAVMSAREAARRAVCMNNLKQIGVAMHVYHAKFGSFPPAYLADKNGRPMHSWRVLLLPYLGHQDLYQQYRFDEPWDGPHNRELANLVPAVYRCPSSGPVAGSPVTSYAVVVGPNTVFPGEKTVKMSDITDGPSNTLLVVEAAKAGIPWLEPRDLSEDRMRFKINGDPNTEISSYHHNGADAAMCDGSAHFFANSIDAQVLKQLIERNDGKVLNTTEFQ